jgi:carbonic anhydrase/SulP family sulfate permease
VTGRKILGSIEYACAVAGAKLVVVLGHTRCGAVGAAVNLACSGETAAAATGCQHLDFVVTEVQKSLDEPTCRAAARTPPAERGPLADAVARRNVVRSVANVTAQSETLAGLVRDGRIMVVGAMYDVTTGAIEFLPA